MTQGAKELRLTLRVRNNRLIAAREMLGLRARKASERIGVSYGLLLRLEGLKQSPLDARSGLWSTTATKIAAFYGGSCSYYWPDAVMSVVEPVRTVEIDAMDVRRIVSPSAMAALTDGSNPEDDVAERERGRLLMNFARGVLTAQELDIIRLRFGLEGNNEHALSEIAEKHELSGERVRQLQEQALAKLHAVYRADRPDHVRRPTEASLLPRFGLSLCKRCSRAFRNSQAIYGVSFLDADTFERTCSKECAIELYTSLLGSAPGRMEVVNKRPNKRWWSNESQPVRKPI